MTVRLTRRADIDVQAFRRVAWGGEDVEIAPAALGQSLAQTGRAAPPALAGLADETLELCPPLTERRSLGPELAALSDRLSAGIPA